MKSICAYTTACLLLFSSNLFAKNCDLKILSLTKKGESSGIAKLEGQKEIFVEGGDKDSAIYEGPASITLKGKTLCKIEGGIFSGMYFSKSKNLLMVEEYSGSCGQHRIIDPTSCKPVGAAAKYCGTAKMSGLQLVNSPPCEPISTDGKTASCSSGKVFDISKSTCELMLNKKASNTLTKKVLGIELPIDDKAYKVINIGMPHAAIVQE